jgi:cell division septation protein DedD
LEKAEKAISMYTEEGLSPYRVKVDLQEKGVWHRVFAGRFEGLEQAETFKQERGLKNSQVKKTQYAALIGIHSYGEALENQILSLKNLGYSPYVMQDHDGRSRLFVGAFLTKEGAEGQWQDLKSNGIQSEVVQR